MILTLDQLRALAASVGFPDPALMGAIAMAESGGNTCAQGDPNIGVHSCDGPNGQSTSFGLWQIHCMRSDGTADPTCAEATRLLQDPLYNAQMAFARSNGGRNVKGPWWTTVVQTGSYKQYLPAGYTSPLEPVVPAETVTPPSGRTPAGLVVVGALALTAAAGFAAYVGRRGRREEPEPQPFVYP